MSKSKIESESEKFETEEESKDSRIEQVKAGKRSFIYKCSKQELEQICKEEKLDFSGLNVDGLRGILSEHYKKKQVCAKGQEIRIMTNYGELKPFDGEKFEVFHQQLDSFINLNDIKEDKKVSLLITKLSPRTFETLTHLCAPAKPNTLSYQELCDKLENKYVKTTSTVLERAKFRQRNQQQNESVEDYILELKKLAGKCQFKDVDDQIMEKFIDGVSSKMIKFELMKTGELKLETCIQVAQAVEAALVQCGSVETQPVTDIFYNQDNRKAWKNKKPTNKPSINNNNKQNGSQCFCCGKSNHLKHECTLRKKYCSECGQQGHIFRMCPRRQRQTNVVETETVEDQRNDVELEPNPYNEYETYSFRSVSRIPPHYMSINMNNHDVPFQLDTGSEVTVISLKDKQTYLHSFQLENCNVVFRNFDQTLTHPLGVISNVTVKHNDVSKNLNVFVVNNDSPRVIGRDWLKALNLWPPYFQNNVNVATNQLQTVSDARQEIKNQFADVFTPGWGNFKGDQIALKLKPDAKPKCLPVRRVPFALRDKVNNEVQRLLKNGRISVVEQSEWGTPVVPILKPDGSVRLCGDYKLTVNNCLEVDHFPLPHVEDILNTLQKGEYYCELDLKEAYLQAPLSPESQDCTTIITEVGTYKYNYLPYGVSSGPGAFQRLMFKKLKDIPNTIVFIDNIYIKGDNLQDTRETLCKVLKKLRECEFKLKPEKCKLFVTSLEVFGYCVDKNGVSIIPSNIEPLLNTKTPTNLTLLKSFLGKINYYNRFLKDMAKIITPLYECTKKNRFNWTTECEEAFQLIKKRLASAENLRHYNPDLPLILTCDASDTGLGAVLSNRDENGTVKPIAYASKKLSEAEQRYSTIDKEAMAVIFGITKFYNYIYGRSFELETDNAALVRIFGPTKSIPKMAAKRLQHYAIFLSAFKYKVRHIKSSVNPADYLSRTVNESVFEDKNVHSLLTDSDSCSFLHINTSEMEILDWKLIQAETKKDVTLTKIIRCLADGWPEKKYVSEDLLPFYSRKQELTVDRGCLFWGYRIIVPTSIRETLLKELHKSHFGIVRMKEIARSYFWWPKLDANIENIVKNCIVCLENSKSPGKIQKPWPVPPSAWYRIHADFLGPFYNKMYLVIVDSYTKWPEVFEMNNITSTRTIEILKRLFTIFGIPVHLVTDNGRSFTSIEFQEFCKSAQIKHTFSPPYHPATNGAAERFVQTFKSTITKIVESGHSMSYAINLFLMDYRNTPQRTTGITPARLMLGRELRNRFNLMRPPPLREEVERKVQNREQGHRNVNFEIGQKVMVKDYRQGSRP
ncbi:hypothetical protein JYU34_020702 [Plutella xylostella]|uniref:RNA-directed DNA polymerase n=1 Tax=Plutella xylostella TaxID=51655 RepID=A0ABQ7PUV9_PLUXY|nr:hypothetical protein JYU34_020702 [Plutella xylostella]